MKIATCTVLALFVGMLGVSIQGCQVRIVIDGSEGSVGFVQVLITQWQYVAVTDLPDLAAIEMCRNLGFDGLNSMTMRPAPVDGSLSVALCNNSDILDPTMDATAGCTTADQNSTTDTLFVDCTTPDIANGTLRLSPVNGSENGTQGMLEVAIGGRWSVVYIPTVSQQEANLVCRVLGLGDAASVTTVTVISLLPIVEVDPSCGNDSIINCIQNGTMAGIQNGNQPLTCLVDSISSVFVQCRGLRPTIFIAPRGSLSNFGAILLAIMTLMIAMAVIIALFFLTLIIMACKKRRHRSGKDSQNTRRPSFWSRARSSVRSRASSYSFVWTRQSQDPNSLPPTDSTSTTGILQGSYLKWTDSDINEQSKSSTLKSAASVDLTTFNSPLDPQPV